MTDYELAEHGQEIDQRYAPRLAMLLECMLLNPQLWHDDAAQLLDKYRAEWNELNPSPSPFGKD